MTKAVLFDLEGTLVQTPWEDPQHVLEFRLETKRKLLELAIPLGILEGIERSTLMRNKASEYVKENFSKTDAHRFHQEMARFLKHYELDAARNSKLFPETLSALEDLKKHGIKIGLVTNTSREAADTVFRLHGLSKYFDAVITRDEVEMLKPDPEGLLLAMKRLGAESFFMVGDLSLDLLATKNASGISIIVKRNPEEEANLHADYRVQSLSEVPSIIQAAMRNES